MFFIIIIIIKYLFNNCFELTLSGGSLPIRKLVNLKTDEKCCIIGTLFKKMELKPSILKEISTEVGYLHCTIFFVLFLIVYLTQYWAV